MSIVANWSIVPGSNNAAPPDGWPEGMARSAVNDTARENMAAVAKWYRDSNGSLVTAGSGNAYTLATNSVYTALASIPMLVFRANRANTGPITLNVDGLGALAVTRDGAAFVSGDIAINQLMVVAYNSATGAFENVGLTNAFDSGTRMLFQQTAAPAGWTKDTSSHNDKALRLVTGSASSGGATPFSSILTSRTIAIANLPAHQHGPGSLALNSTAITVVNGTSIAHASGSTNTGTGGSNDPQTNTTVTITASLNSGALNAAGVTSLVGSGTAMDFAVQYADAIIAAKA